VPHHDTFHAAVKLCAQRWNLEIMTALQRRPLRYTDLLHAIRPTPPSSKSLNEALHRLQDQDLVRHTVGPHGRLYALTPAGHHLLPLLLTFMADLRRWAERYHHADTATVDAKQPPTP
jgi:DNA-binding HxlR family transcriptional regulator